MLTISQKPFVLEQRWCFLYCLHTVVIADTIIYPQSCTREVLTQVFVYTDHFNGSTKTHHNLLFDSKGSRSLLLRRASILSHEDLITLFPARSLLVAISLSLSRSRRLSSLRRS